MLSAALAITVLLIGAAPAKPSAEDLAEYREAKAKVGRGADAQVALALWCESHGMAAERLEHLAMAVLVDPGNATARGLMGQVADDGKWKKPDDLAEKVRDDARLATALADYAQKREKAAKTSEGHWKLALWCEENGLDAEAKAHLTACVRLDPARSAAWKRLGCKKVNGRWVTDAQIAERKAEIDAQEKADKFWRPQLAAWRVAQRGKDANKRAEATEGLNSVKDPRASASIWRVFVLGGGTPPDLVRAVQLFGQIESPASSRALAMIALDGTSPDLRRTAVETLARRDPRDFMGELISLLRDELRYEVRPVGGPGSAGVLFVEGQQFNRMRIYAPPAANLPLVDPYVGVWTTDAEGFAEVHILGALNVPGRVISAVGGHGQPLVAPGHGVTIPFDPGGVAGSHPQKVTVKQQVDIHATDTTIPIGRMAAEARRTALAAQEQLRQDVAVVEAENANIRARNARVTEVLNNATNQALPPKRDVWRPWWADQRGYAYVEPPATPRPTFVEKVEPAYIPRPIGPVTEVGGVIGQTQSVHTYQDCFAAGTPVRTRTGMRPIESLEVGDHVLAQDTTTGALAYKPILAVFKFRPAETLKIAFGGDTLLTTGVHRFWRIGEGWVMARDLKPGDTVRALGRSVAVEAIEKDVVRQVFNLEVAECSDYFVGRDGILAGDNTMMGPRRKPFDSPSTLSATPGRR